MPALGNDNYTLLVRASVTTGATTVALDGDWMNGTSTGNSGNGTPGGNFVDGGPGNDSFIFENSVQNFHVDITDTGNDNGDSLDVFTDSTGTTIVDGARKRIVRDGETLVYSRLVGQNSLQFFKNLALLASVSSIDVTSEFALVF